MTRAMIGRIKCIVSLIKHSPDVKSVTEVCALWSYNKHSPCKERVSWANLGASYEVNNVINKNM